MTTDERELVGRTGESLRGWRADVAGTLLGLSHELARSSSIEEICRLVAGAIPYTIETPVTAVLLWDPLQETLRVVEVDGLSPEMTETAKKFEITLDDVPGLMEFAADPRLVIFDGSTDNAVARENLERFGLAGSVAVPIVSRGRFLGFLTAILTPGSQMSLSEIDTEYLTGLADLAATALDVAYQTDEARRRGETSTALLELASDLVRLAEPRQIATLVAEAVPKVVTADASAFLFVDRERGTLSVAGMWGWPEAVVDAVAEFEVPIDAAPIIQEAIDHPDPLYVTADIDDPLVAAILEEYDTDTALVVPVVARGVGIGAVAAVNRGAAPARMDPLVAERLKGLADQAATALDNSRLLSELQAQVAALAERERELSEARSTLAHLIDSGPLVTFRGTTDGFVINYVSQSLERIAGYSPEVFLRENWLDFVHPADRDRAYLQILQILEEDEVSFAMRFRVADGTWRRVRVHLRRGRREPSGHHEVLGYVWDQTEQWEAEERHRIVSELTSDVAYSYRIREDGTGELEWSTGGLDTITGYDPRTTFEMGGWPAMVPPEDREAYRERVRRLIEGQTVSDVFRVVTRSGDMRWLRIHARPVHDEETGRVIRILGAAQDVTDERRAEELHRVISDAVSDAAFAYRVVDGVLVLDWVTEAFGRLTGYEVSEPLADELFMPIIHEEDEAIARDAEETVLRGETSIAEFRVRARDGGIRWLRIYAAPVRDEATGRVQRVYGAAQDVTARRRAEEAMRASEARFRGLVEASPLATVGLDTESRVTWWNPAAGRLLGWAPHEAVGQRVPFVEPESWQGIVAFLTEAIREGETISNLEITAVAKDGRAMEALLNLAPLPEPGGRPSGAVVVLVDVREQRALERRLRQAEKMGALGRLAGGVAHDFNNLLTAILGNAEMLVEDLDDPELWEAADDVRAAAEQAATLTEQMLMFSRHQPIDAVVIDVDTMISNTLSVLQRVAGESVEISLDLCRDDTWVRLPRAQLEQVLLNLAVNARDAMPEGGRLRVATRVERGQPDEVVLTVADTGVGMDDDTRRHAFDPFFTTRASGTGLGLSVVYGTVEAAGGTIAVESVPGEGSTFVVRLPRSPIPPSDQSTQQPAAAVPARATARVLVVEDEPGVRSMARRALERSGFDVVDVDGPERALECSAAGDAFDVVVTDVVMPEMNGRALIDELRRHNRELPAVLVSGYTEEPAHGEDGGDVFLQKPFTPRDIVEAVRRVLP